MPNTLVERVSEVLRHRRATARVIEDGPACVLVYDYCDWDKKTLTAIETFFPSVDWELESCSKSLSQVRMRFALKREGRSELVWLAWIGLQVSVCVYMLLRM